MLTNSENPQTYWRVLKKRLLDEGNETVTNCNALKMTAEEGEREKGEKIYYPNSAMRCSNVSRFSLARFRMAAR